MGWAANIWLWNAPRPTFDSGGQENGDTSLHKKLNVVFTNELDENVDLFWVSHSGEEQLSKMIAKHEIFSVNTYKGHRWIVKKAGSADNLGTNRIGSWDIKD